MYTHCEASDGIEIGFLYNLVRVLILSEGDCCCGFCGFSDDDNVDDNFNNFPYQVSDFFCLDSGSWVIDRRVHSSIQSPNSVVMSCVI